MRLDLIRLDGGTQPRVRLDEDVTASYEDAYRAGQAIPPVVVFHDGSDYWLADGFHRYHAAAHAMLDEIPADIRTGTRRDAVLFSVGANATHGLRRTNADKRKAVETLLNDGEWGQWSDRQIAASCAVSHTLVAGVRASLTGNIASEIPPETRKYITKHGTESVMKPASRGADAKRDGLYETGRKAEYPQECDGVTGNISTYPQGDAESGRSEASNPQRATGAEAPMGPADSNPDAVVASESSYLHEQIEDLQYELTNLMAQVDGKVDERLSALTAQLRAVERQRDDYMNQVAQLKQQIKIEQAKVRRANANRPA